MPHQISMQDFSEEAKRQNIRHVTEMVHRNYDWIHPSTQAKLEHLIADLQQMPAMADPAAFNRILDIYGDIYTCLKEEATLLIATNDKEKVPPSWYLFSKADVNMQVFVRIALALSLDMPMTIIGDEEEVLTAIHAYNALLIVNQALEEE